MSAGYLVGDAGLDVTRMEADSPYRERCQNYPFRRLGPFHTFSASRVGHY